MAALTPLQEDTTMTTIIHTETHTLYRIGRRYAEYLMMAPAVAGGWVAVHPDCTEAVGEAVDADAPAGVTVNTYLALLPTAWMPDHGIPVDHDMTERIIARLDAHAAYSLLDEPQVPAEFAARLRALLPVAG